MCPNNIFVSVIPLLTVNYRCYFVYNRLWYWRTFNIYDEVCKFKQCICQLNRLNGLDTS